MLYQVVNPHQPSLLRGTIHLTSHCFRPIPPKLFAATAHCLDEEPGAGIIIILWSFAVKA